MQICKISIKKILDCFGVAFFLKTLSTLFQIATVLCRVRALCLPVDGRPRGSHPTKNCSNLIAFFLISAFAFATSAFASSQDYYIDYLKHYKIHLKEKKSDNADKINHPVIVLIAPLSIPSLEAFDVPGYSLMDTLSDAGFDVWGVDLIGQGKSSFLPEMQENPAPMGLLPLRAKEAIPQLHQAISFITNKTNQKTISLLGWSWGGVVAAMYCIDYPQQMNHLILYGTMYSFLLPESEQKMFLKPYESNNESNNHHQFNKNLPAYQNVPWSIVLKHWQNMIQNNKLNNNVNNKIASQQGFNSVGKVYEHMDPHPIIKNTIRRPIGPMRDLFSIWNNEPIYDIKKLSTPTLVIYGDQDTFADRGLYNQLINVPIKKEVVLPEATHWLIYEKTRPQFDDAVFDFLRH